MTPELAYSAYVAFYNLFGRAHLDGNIMNLESVRALCLQFQQERGEDKLPPRPVTFSCLRAVAADSPAAGATDGSSGNNSSSKLNVGSSAGGGGNLLAGTEAAAAINDELHNLIARDTTCSSSSSGEFSRHLKGNWLAYWEHEIGRADSETFNLKQIRLQGFAGHSAGIKCLHALDGENSFMTGSRDKTVKVWSLRSQGDGTAKVGSQWTYSLHKRSVFFVTFLERARLAVSCDSAVHVWDPFVGSVVHQVDAAQRLGPVHVVAPLAEPSSVVVVATQDSLLHLVDCRVGSVTADLKVSVGSAGLVRALSTSCDGNTMLVGHTSGSLSTLDLRTGKLRHSWKVRQKPRNFYFVKTIYRCKVFYFCTKSVTIMLAAARTVRAAKSDVMFFRKKSRFSSLQPKLPRSSDVFSLAGMVGSGCSSKGNSDGTCTSSS